MLSRKELVMAEDSPRITVSHMTTFRCSLGVLAGVEVHDTAQARRGA